MSSEDVQSHRRLFFALWPPAELSGRLAALAASAKAVCGGRAMKRETLHLTLAFLGCVPADKAEKVLEVAAGIRGEPFQLVLDRVRCWGHNHIVWTGPSVMPPALAALAGQLAQGLGAAGFTLEKRAFAAHITLLRNARCAETPPDFKPITWQARDFVLVESRLSPQGAAYEIVGRWRLASVGPEGGETE